MTLEEEDRPIAALVVSLLGSILIFAEGVLLIIATTSAGPLDNSPGPAGMGLLGAFLGFILVTLSLIMYWSPESHVGYGIAILVFSILAIFSGGGFFVGTILGAIGGVLALIFTPSYDPFEEGVGDGGSVEERFRRCPFCETQMPASGRFCPSCGRESPAA